MAIGDVIKKYRKNKGMTQEEMAACLGITTPAVNKWERGNTLPDITLLAPIARLLDITTDELLSFKDELTDEEINQYLSIVQKDLKDKSFHEVFISVKEKIHNIRMVREVSALKERTNSQPSGRFTVPCVFSARRL